MPYIAMQTVSVNTLGFKLNYEVPSSVEEFDRLAKRNGAALDEANKNVIYRSVLATFRDGFLHGLDEVKDSGGNVVRSAIKGLEELTDIKRAVKVTKPEVKDADGKITQEEVTAWDEKEDAYKERVFATLATNGTFPSTEAAAASYQTTAQDVINAIAFDPSKTERQSAGPKTTPKTYFGIADALIEMAGSIDLAAAKFATKTGRAVEATREALAKGIWEDQAAQKKNIAAGYAS